jgi:hypothetical protein
MFTAGRFCLGEVSFRHPGDGTVALCARRSRQHRHELRLIPIQLSEHGHLMGEQSGGSEIVP